MTRRLQGAPVRRHATRSRRATPPRRASSRRSAARPSRSRSRHAASSPRRCRSPGSRLAALEDVLRGMAPLPGRKLCLLVSDGFLVGRGTREEQTRQLQQVTDAATRSGLAVYALAGQRRRADRPRRLHAGLPRDRRACAKASRRAGEQVTFEGAAGPGGRHGRSRVARERRDRRRPRPHAAGQPTPCTCSPTSPPTASATGASGRSTCGCPAAATTSVRTRRGYFAPGGSRRAKPGQRAARPAGRCPSLAGPVPLSLRRPQRALATPPPRAGVPVRVAADYVELAPGRPAGRREGSCGPGGAALEEGRRAPAGRVRPGRRRLRRERPARVRSSRASTTRST